jgi:hypothetical protein
LLQDQINQLEIDDIRVEYHPNSGLPSKTIHFEDFTRDVEQSEASIPDEPPYKPWRSQADFEFSEIALESAMNRNQIEAMIKLIRHVAQSPESFTLKNQVDYTQCFEHASVLLTPVSTSLFSASLHIFMRYFSSTNRRSRFLLKGKTIHLMFGHGLYGIGRLIKSKTLL